MSLSRALTVTATAAIAASATVIVLTTAAATMTYVMVDLLTATDQQRPQGRRRKEGVKPSSKREQTGITPTPEDKPEGSMSKPQRQEIDGNGHITRRHRSNSTCTREKQNNITGNPGPARRTRSDSPYLAMSPSGTSSSTSIAFARAAVDALPPKSSHTPYFKVPAIITVQDDDFVLLTREPSEGSISSATSDLQSDDELEAYFSFPGSGAISPVPYPDYLQAVAPVSLNEVLEKLMKSGIDRSASGAESEAASEKSWTTAWQ